ncbi:MAG: hypothetical protein AAF432_14965, partial [Planctomycetota bacterium]
MKWLRPIHVLCACLVVLGIVGQTTAQDAAPEAAQDAAPTFLDQVDLTPLDEVAVYTQGRLKSFESFVRELMQFVTGGKSIDGHPLGVTYFDLMFRSSLYADKDFIYVKMKLMRYEISDALLKSVREDIDKTDFARVSPGVNREMMENHYADLEARMEIFRDTGLVSPQVLLDPTVDDVLRRMSTDLMRTASKVTALDTAMSIRRPDILRANFMAIASTESDDDPWFGPDQLRQVVSMRDATPEELAVIDAWTAFSSAWMSEDAAGVNAAARQLADALPMVNPGVYPEQGRLAAESWYFKAPAWAGGRNMVGVWLYYALAFVPLLLSVVFRWRGAHWIGMAIFLAAFALHTAAILLRWYVAQRWPNTNMFEAVTTAAWFGGCFAVLAEAFLWRMPLRGLIALGSAGASAVAMMAAKFMPTYLNPNISNRMPVLHDLWLYIHT